MELQGGIEFTRPALLARVLETLKDGGTYTLSFSQSPYPVRIQKRFADGRVEYRVEWRDHEKTFSNSGDNTGDLENQVGCYVENLEQLHSPAFPKPQNLVL